MIVDVHRLYTTILLFCSIPTLHSQWNQWDLLDPTCRDNDGYVDCYRVYITGRCVYDRQNQLDSCRRTCNLCHVTTRTTKPPPPRRCRDKKKNCRGWKKYCSPDSKWYSYMHRNCPKTCRMCRKCEDRTALCPGFGKRGYCKSGNRYYRYMRKHCANTCDLCVGVRPMVIQPTEITTRSPPRPQYTCAFVKDECDWMNPWIDDTADWVVGLDEENGPKAGQGGNGTYLYLDSRYVHQKGWLRLPWQLVLPMDALDSGLMCFSFSYQMNGGRLLLKQVRNPTMRRKRGTESVLVQRLNNKSRWVRMRVTVNADQKNSLRFEGNKQEGGFLGLDEFQFVRGSC